MAPFPRDARDFLTDSSASSRLRVSFGPTPPSPIASSKCPPPSSPSPSLAPAVQAVIDGRSRPLSPVLTSCLRHPGSRIDPGVLRPGMRVLQLQGLGPRPDAPHAHHRLPRRFPFRARRCTTCGCLPVPECSGHGCAPTRTLRDAARFHPLPGRSRPIGVDAASLAHCPRSDGGHRQRRAGGKLAARRGFLRSSRSSDA